MMPTLQVSLVRLQVDLAGRFQMCSLIRLDVNANLVGNIVGDGALKGQDILKIAFVALGPDALVLRSIDELSRNPHLIAGAQYRPLDDAVNLKLPRDIRERLVRIL